MKSKKVGILTFHKSFNYGAFLQCYSLVKRITDDLPDVHVEVIDYTPNSVVQTYRTSLIKYLIDQIKKGFNNLFYERNQVIYRIFHHIFHADYYKKLDVRNKNIISSWDQLKLSNYSLITDDYNKLFEIIKDKYDVLIVGSDAVWNWKVRGFPNAYFLNSNISAFKFSYAASSFGQDFMLLSNEKKDYLTQSWNDFYYIGTRDSATEEFVKSFCKKTTPNHNCDPTIFLDLKQFENYKTIVKAKMRTLGVDFSKKLVGIMGGEWLGLKLKEVLKDDFQIISLYEPNKYADFDFMDLTPMEWAIVFSFFDLTVTHYFHGTIFSLKNSTPTIVVEKETEYSKKHDTKIKDLLKRLNLLDCYFIKEDLDKSSWEKFNKHVHSFLHKKIVNSNNITLEEEAKYYYDFLIALKLVLFDKK